MTAKYAKEIAANIERAEESIQTAREIILTGHWV